MAIAFAFNEKDRTAIAFKQHAPNSPTEIRPKMRYNASLKKISFGAQQFERPTVVVIDTNIVGTLTSAVTRFPFIRLEDFTTALSGVVIWDDNCLRATFSALSEDYDVAATEESSLSASKRFGW